MSEFCGDMTFTWQPGDDPDAAAVFMALFDPVEPPTLVELSDDGVGTYRVLDVQPEGDDGFVITVEPK